MKTLRAMIFEDSSSLKTTLFELLSLRGFDVYRPEDFESAEYFLNTDPSIDAFDIIFIDLNMPYENGYFSVDEEEEINNLSSEIKLPGWIWIKRIIKKYPEALKKVVVFSAYANIILSQGENIVPTITILNKGTKDSEQRILEILEKIKTQ